MSTQGKMNKVTVPFVQEMKRKGEKIVMITAYDYPTALIVEEAGVDLILVGDTLGMVVLGYESTLPVTMDEMIHHTKAVSRAAQRVMVVGDMPFLSYQVSVEDAVANAGRFLKEAGAHSVKLEGGREVAETVRRICAAGIPVMAHLGLTPQSIHQFGGYKVQGREEAAARRICDDALILQDAGAFSIVLECVPSALAKEITASLTIPTIGIGGGVDCDGQVLVIHDLLGMFDRFTPTFVKKYVNAKSVMKDAVAQYVSEVKDKTFPDEAHSYR